jgi:hypothetical protein
MIRKPFFSDEEDDMKMHTRTLARTLFVTGVIALATTTPSCGTSMLGKIS